MRPSILIAIVALAMTLIALPRANAQGASAEPTAEAGAIQVRGLDGTVAWYEPAPGEAGVYVYSGELNHPVSNIPFLSLFVKEGRSKQAVFLFLFGLIGQAMFMGRFALQWIVSEREGRSVVPLGFWWLSLAGASILLTYFALQREPIGILGQVLGWPIYLRNVYMVLRDRREGVVNSADPAEHPVPDPNAEA